MAEVLKGPAIGPTGVRYPAGHAVPSGEPDWFIADLRAAGQSVTAAAKTTARKPSREKAK